MSVRFAPSPTGTFHIGNLRTAWISRQLADRLRMPWIVRFEDIDRPRVLPGAQEQQLADMKALGLVPDQVLLQSSRAQRHEHLFEEARRRGDIYPCICSRKEILEHLGQMASAPHGEAPIYDGRCRESDAAEGASSGSSLAWRFKNPEDSSGGRDFVIGRSDPKTGFQPSYHWACAIDDHDGDHRLLVRAQDLSHVIPLQSLIYHWVSALEGSGHSYPAVFHTSLVTTNEGGRLEKRTRGVTLAEIIGRGITPEEVITSFRKSLDGSLLKQFSAGRIWGESAEKIPLSRLGLG